MRPLSQDELTGVGLIKHTRHPRSASDLAWRRGQTERKGELTTNPTSSKRPESSLRRPRATRLVMRSLPFDQHEERRPGESRRGHATTERTNSERATSRAAPGPRTSRRARASHEARQGVTGLGPSGVEIPAARAGDGGGREASGEGQVQAKGSLGKLCFKKAGDQARRETCHAALRLCERAQTSGLSAIACAANFSARPDGAN